MVTNIQIVASAPGIFASNGAAVPFPTVKRGDIIGIPSGRVGVTQINFVVPPDTPLGIQQVVVTIGTASSPPVNITVTQ